MLPYITRIFVLSVFIALLWADHGGDFKIVGPGGGGAMFNPTISPHDENTVLVSCDMTGGYITHNGGRSWRMFNLRGTVRFFAFDPMNSKTLYAYVTGLWRSTDGGETWNLIYPKPSAVRGIKMNSDHADETIVADPDPLGRIEAFAVDPADSRILYAAAGHDKDAALYVSRDYGASWQRESRLTEVARNMWIDPHSPPESRSVFMIGTHKITVRTSAGIRSLPAPGHKALTSGSLGFRPDGLPVIYVVAGENAFVSSDSGLTWQQCSLPGDSAEVRAIATSFRHPLTAYLSFSQLSLNGGRWLGVAKTTDAGRTWALVWKENESAAPNVHDAWITARFGPGWPENPLMLGVADQNPDLSYGTDLGRTMRTVDGGLNWNAVYSREVSPGAWTTTGLDVTTNYGIHFDPFDTNRQFITYTDIGLFRSEDGGQSWVSSTMGVPRKWLNTTYWVAFDPQVRGRMWSANSYTHDLPRPKMWRRNSVQTYAGGVCRSDDGGKTWTQSNTGMPEAAVTYVMLDPKSPLAHRILYVAAFGKGVYKSGDGGDTWTQKNNGITQAEPFAWRLGRSPDGTLYLIVARRSDDGSIGTGGDGALYKSTDGAEHWKPVQLPVGVNGPNGLAIDPESPNRLYLAAWARATPNLHGDGGGIYVSENSGGTWRNVLDRDQHVYDVTVDTRNPSLIYAAGFESSAWRSVDHGEHWVRLPGFNFKWGHRVVLDPNDPGKIYVTTFGGSVWHGPVNGRPKILDIATPELMP